MRIKDLVGFLSNDTRILLYENVSGSRQNIYFDDFGKLPRSMYTLFIMNISLAKYSNCSVIEMFVSNPVLRKR